MPEQEWLQVTDPQPMLEFLRDKTSDRKLRLFAVVSCRRVSRLLFPAGQAEALLEIIERYADGSASKEEVTAFLSGMLPLPVREQPVRERPVREQRVEVSVPLWWWMTADMLQGGVRNIALVANWIDARVIGASAFQCNWLRDLFGPLPFHTLMLNSAWLTWHDSTVVRLA